jgi:hypothetical protein
MPLLQGKFDPLRFNSTTLAKWIYEADTGCPWNEASEADKMNFIDYSQHLIDDLAQMGVIS